MLSQNISEIVEIPDEGILMPDGCRLSARIWRPQNAHDIPVPAILEFLPYRKRDGTTARDALTHPYFAKRGFASVRVDMRGNGDSEGVMEDEYTQQELDDAYDTIAWIAAQPWCTGKVGMMGISWGGFNALQVAAMDPPALKAIITLCSTVDRFADDIHYKGGCLLNENMGWGSTMWGYSSRPPDPALVGERWRDMWLTRLENEPYLPMTWLKHQTRDAYWQHGSVCEDYSVIKAATLAIGGWGDAYKNTVSHLVENLSGPVKGIVGPWVHKYPHFAVPEPRIGFLQEALRWWDRWLKDIDTGVEEDPAYSAYLMEGVRPKTFYEEREGIWIVEDDWPKGLSWQSVYFKADGGLGEIPETLSHSVKSPQTCGMQSGEYCAIWLGPELPGDQRKDDAMSICYTSSPLSEDYAIVGAPKVHLKLSSDKPQAQLVVRLTHIHPDGASTRITYGVLNLSHRVSHAKPEPLPLGEAIDVSLTLDQIAYRVPKGHKIRVAVSTSYWPLLWPSPEATTLCLHQGSIDIPLRQSSLKDERVFPPAQTETPWDIEILRPASNARRVIEDMHSGTVTLEILDDFGKNKDRDHGLVSGGIAREWWAIHPDDPLSAHGKTHWTMENGRDGWQTRTESYAEMRADHENYYLTARLEAYENDTLFFEKDLSETIPRHGA
ncbi:MAG: CocE/NonD family hydrolase [Paracoccaceae bacterium]